MRNILNLACGIAKSKIVSKKRTLLGFHQFCENNQLYSLKGIIQKGDFNRIIYDKINLLMPFCVSRFGAVELFASSCFEFDIKCKQHKALDSLCNNAGFFPNKLDLGNKFNECFREACANIDFLGVWALRFEEYYVTKYMNEDIQLTPLFNLEPWRYCDKPWSAALKGKKVLVIHPFEETIKSQYARREKIFPDTDILPEFELKTLKAVQTIAGERDERFETWFDALDWMYEEALKIDFDVAIIGCGAYGLPLAAKLKEAGKLAIHLGGATQILFGIRGKRWDEDENQSEVRRWFNEFWVYPSIEEIPKNFQQIEGGAYWE